LEDDGTGQDLPRMKHEELEQQALRARELDLTVPAFHLMSDRIERQIAEPQDLPRRARPRSAQQRAQPREQLVEREWLDDVVVGPGVEARDPVGDRIAGG